MKAKEEKKTLETKKLAINGIITEMTFGKKFKDTEPRYHVSVKISEETRDKLIEIAAPYFENVEERFIPEWLNAKSLYINLKSKYPVKVMTEGGTDEHVIRENEDYVGARGTVLANLKEKGLYLAGVVCKDQKEKTLENFFKGDVTTC